MTQITRLMGRSGLGLLTDSREELPAVLTPKASPTMLSTDLFEALVPGRKKTKIPHVFNFAWYSASIGLLMTLTPLLALYGQKSSRTAQKFLDNESVKTEVVTDFTENAVFTRSMGLPEGTVLQSKRGQEKYLELHDLFYENSRSLDTDSVILQKLWANEPEKKVHGIVWRTLQSMSAKAENSNSDFKKANNLFPLPKRVSDFGMRHLDLISSIKSLC